MELAQNALVIAINTPPVIYSLRISDSILEVRRRQSAREGDMHPGKPKALGQEKEVKVYGLSKIFTLGEIDTNMQNHSFYIYIDSKIVF